MTISSPISSPDPILDLLVVEPRSDPRIVVSLPGQFWLGGKRDERGVIRPFTGRAINISTDEVALVGPAQTWVGDTMSAEIQHFGRLEGNIIRLLGEQAIVMGIEATASQRRNLASKIAWVEKFTNHDVADGRTDQRFFPKNPVSILILADGSCIPCLIANLSTIGAAITSDLRPKLGAVLALGRIVGRVIRHHDDGFAVRFIENQDRRKIEALATRR